MSRFDDAPVGGDQQGNAYLVRASKKLDPDRARGALLGLAVGDALGTTLEFHAAPPQPFAPPLAGPHVDIIGGGPFHVAPGQVTDDTQQATVLARSLMEHGGFKVEPTGAAYVEWSRHAFDIGGQTRDALRRVREGTPASDASREAWIAGGRRAAGNGSLMRTIPIALFYQPDPPRRREVSMEDSAITHFDPRCQLACAAYNGAVAAAVRGPARSPLELLDAALEDLNLGEAELTARYPQEASPIAAAGDSLRADLRAATTADPDLYGSEMHMGRTAGFVRVAFRLAFWQLVHATSFESALIDTVNRGGDTDTNGAIVGGLLGACFGASAIPARWSDVVLGSLCGDTGVFGATWHPRQLLELLP